VIVSRKAFAAELGINVSRVSHFAKAGMPVVPGVGVDRDIALGWVKANVQPQLGRNAGKAGVRVSEIAAAASNGHGEIGVSETPIATPTDGPRFDPAQQRARRDAAMAEKLEWENLKRSGELCELADVFSSVSEDYNIIRNQLSAIGSKLAPRIVGLRNAEEVKAAIDAEVTRILEVLSEDDVYQAAKAGASA
jgi:hypothetical protein